MVREESMRDRSVTVPEAEMLSAYTPQDYFKEMEYNAYDREKALKNAAYQKVMKAAAMQFAQQEKITQEKQQNLNFARKRYIKAMRKAIRGIPNEVFGNPAVGVSQPIDSFKSNIGSEVASMGMVNRVTMDVRQKKAADMIASQQFLFPDTDPLAYSRRI
jgi:uncharacterized protein YnzC (UPF0291/DUF896 family)